jgi:hypothetical protein
VGWTEEPQHSLCRGLFSAYEGEVRSRFQEQQAEQRCACRWFRTARALRQILLCQHRSLPQLPKQHAERLYTPIACAIIAGTRYHRWIAEPDGDVFGQEEQWSAGLIRHDRGVGPNARTHRSLLQPAVALLHNESTGQLGEDLAFLVARCIPVGVDPATLDCVTKATHHSSSLLLRVASSFGSASAHRRDLPP